MIKPIIFKPSNPEVELLFNNFYNMHHPHDKVMRVSPKISITLSKHRAIRELMDQEMLDIGHKHSGNHKSFIILNHNVKIEKNNNRFIFRI